jgi:predicted lactoylglutathione lyase
MKLISAGLLACAMVGCCYSVDASPNTPQGPASMQLGNFCISLAVKDLGASRAFYEKLGFTAVAGDGKAWQVMKNASTKIALFQGMFEKNMLTFNPGWDSNGKQLASFQDVRDIQKALIATGITPTQSADVASTGPAFLMVVDPDGNPILIDQHVPKPEK